MNKNLRRRRLKILYKIAESNYFEYEIESGDSIYALAKFYGVENSEIKDKQGNPVKKIKIGDIVRIPLKEGRGNIDEEVLASALMAEGGSVHGEEMMKKIYTIIKNRMNHSCFPNTAIEVVEQKNQFEYTIREYKDKKGSFKPYPSNKMRFIKYWKYHKFPYIKERFKKALKIVQENKQDENMTDSLFFITKNLYESKKNDDSDMWGNGCFIIRHSDDGHHYGTLDFDNKSSKGNPCRISNCK